MVLSLFDGMSCGREVIRQLGVPAEQLKYFASETDPHAIAVAQANFPDTIQLGDVRQVRYVPVIADPSQSYLVGADGVKHVVGKVHFVIGGSPCQGVSCAGTGTMLEHPESVLFQEYERLVGACNPDWHLLENVRKAEFEQYLSAQLAKYGAKLYKLNSDKWASARRARNYWTNIPFDSTKPPTPSTIGSPLTMQGVIGNDYEGVWKRQVNFDRRSNRAVYFFRKLDKMYCLTKDSRGQYFPIRTADLVHMDKFNAQPNITHHELTKFTPAELEMMHGLPVGYTRAVSEAQAGVMIGNGWTVPVICDLLRAGFA